MRLIDVLLGAVFALSAFQVSVYVLLLYFHLAFPRSQRWDPVLFLHPLFLSTIDDRWSLEDLFARCFLIHPAVFVCLPCSGWLYNKTLLLTV